MFRRAHRFEVERASTLPWDAPGLAWEPDLDACLWFPTSRDGDLEGIVDAPQRTALHRRLRAHGAGDVVVVYWRGYPEVRPDLASVATSTVLGDEEYLVALATLDDVDLPFLTHSSIYECLYPEWMWASDRSWVTYLDKDSTRCFVGGSDELTRDLLTDATLNARAVPCNDA